MATQVTYEGPPRGALILAQMLKDEGLEIDYRAPMEKRDSSSWNELVQVALNEGESALGGGLAAGLGVAIRRFRARIGDAPVSLAVKSDEIPADELDI